jgi:hypothetical protein
VVELTDQLVEEVPGRCGVPVAVVSPAPIVIASWLTVCCCGESPNPTNGSESGVLDPAVCDRQRAPGGAGDRCRSGVGLQGTGIGESGAIIADFGENSSAGRGGQAREAGNDRVVGMGLEQFCGGPGFSRGG